MYENHPVALANGKRHRLGECGRRIDKHQIGIKRKGAKQFRHNPETSSEVSGRSHGPHTRMRFAARSAKPPVRSESPSLPPRGAGEVRPARKAKHRVEVPTGEVQVNHLYSHAPRGCGNRSARHDGRLANAASSRAERKNGRAGPLGRQRRPRSSRGATPSPFCRGSGTGAASISADGAGDTPSSGQRQGRCPPSQRETSATQRVTSAQARPSRHGRRTQWRPQG